MSVVVFVSNTNGKVSKAGMEAVYYASKVAAAKGTSTTAVSFGAIGNDQLAALGNAGATKAIKVVNDRLDNVDSRAYTKVVDEVAKAVGANTVIFPETSPPNMLPHV